MTTNLDALVERLLNEAEYDDKLAQTIVRLAEEGGVAGDLAGRLIKSQAADAMREAATTLTTLSDKNAKLAEALTKCRDKFDEYVRLHQAKLHDGTPTSEWLSVHKKVERNREMVALCNQALGDQPHD